MTEFTSLSYKFGVLLYKQCNNVKYLSLINCDCNMRHLHPEYRSHQEQLDITYFPLVVNPFLLTCTLNHST